MGLWRELFNESSSVAPLKAFAASLESEYVQTRLMPFKLFLLTSSDAG